MNGIWFNGRLIQSEMSNIDENWRQKFTNVTNSIKETASISELQGITAVGMLKMLDYQLTGQYPRVGLNTTPFSGSDQDKSPIQG